MEPSTNNDRPDEKELQAVIDAVLPLPSDTQRRLADAISLARLFTAPADGKKESA